MSDNEYKTESYTILKAKCKYSSLDNMSIYRY